MTSNKLTALPHPGDADKTPTSSWDWLAWFKKIAILLSGWIKLKTRVRGYQHVTDVYWLVLVAKVLSGLSSAEASDWLNELMFARANARLRRKRAPRKLGSVNGERHARLVPHQTQVDAFQRAIPKWAAKQLVNLVFKAQLQVARAAGLLGREARFLVDYTEHAYYGQLQPRDDPLITGTTKQQGTRRARNFLAAMVVSGTTRLFCGLTHVPKGADRPALVLAMLDEVRALGVNVKWLLADRGFWNLHLVAGCVVRGVKFLTPAKSYKKVKALARAYLLGTGDRVVEYPMSGAPAKWYKCGTVRGWLVFGLTKGHSLRDVRARVDAGSLPVNDALKLVYALYTTAEPPSKARAWNAWVQNLRRLYKVRWYIETAFRDVNRLVDVEHPRSHVGKFFALGLRMAVYNAWQVERARWRRTRVTPRCRRRGPTLARFLRDQQARVAPVEVI